jgi:hypothetical protein
VSKGQYFSIAQINEAIKKELDKLNNKLLTYCDYSRNDQFKRSENSYSHFRFTGMKSRLTKEPKYRKWDIFYAVLTKTTIAYRTDTLANM